MENTKSNDFVKYLKTTNKNDIDDLIELLTKNKIEYEVENLPLNFNSSLNVDINTLEYTIKISNSDFDRVEMLEIEYYENILENIDNEYYLFGFNNDELIDIIKNGDEWSKLDFILAKEILKSKGIEFNKEQIDDFKKQKIESLTIPEKNQGTWIVLGYIFSLLGGLLGIIIGYHISTHKKVLPNGEKVFEYKEKDRKHGERILLIGVLMLTFGFLRYLFSL